MNKHAAFVIAATLVLITSLLIQFSRRREHFADLPKTHRFSTTEKPWGVAFSKDNKYLFVAGAKLEVYKIDGLKAKLFRSISFTDGSVARGVSVSPDGSKLVVGKDDNIMFFSTQALVTPSQKPHLATVPVPSLTTGNQKRAPNAAEPTFSADGTRVACPLEYRNQVMIVDVNLALAKRGPAAVIGLIPAGSAPVGISFFPGRYENMMAFTSQSDPDAKVPGSKCSGSVRVADIKTMKIIKTIPVGCDPVRIAVGKNYFYVTSRGNDKVIKITKGKDNSARTEISVGKAPVGIKLTPDERYAIVAASNRFDPKGTGEINVVDTETLKVTRIPGLKFPRGVAVNSTGTMAAVTYYNSAAVELVSLA
jgi:hypothetical protein